MELSCPGLPAGSRKKNFPESHIINPLLTKLSCSGLPAGSRKKNFPESHIINPLLTKLVRSRWLDIGLVFFFASLWTSTPHTWSITHTYRNHRGGYRAHWKQGWSGEERACLYASVSQIPIVDSRCQNFASRITPPL